MYKAPSQNSGVCVLKQQTILIYNLNYTLRANSTFAPDSCPILLKFKKIKFVQLSTGKYFLPKIAQIF